jgi:hypothetical protein
MKTEPAGLVIRLALQRKEALILRSFTVLKERER